MDLIKILEDHIEKPTKALLDEIHALLQQTSEKRAIQDVQDVTRNALEMKQHFGLADALYVLALNPNNFTLVKELLKISEIKMLKSHPILDHYNIA